MLTNNYLVTLKPITPYFFGGENTFGEGQEAEFFVRSNYLPQQTTLLGFLRYELLQQNNLLGTDPGEKKWSDLIGPKSFQSINGTFTSNFGAIKKISPVFISNKTESYICQSFDWGMCEAEDSKDKERSILAPLEYGFSPLIGNIITNNFKNRIPTFTANGKPFKQKNGIQTLWVRADGGSMRQWDFEDDETFEKGRGFDNGLFISQEQVGNEKKAKRTPKDTGDFYKIVSFRLANDFAFSFFAELDLPDDKKIRDRIVTMGGERSVFQMHVEQTQERFDTLFTANTFRSKRKDSRKAVVLTSDTFCKAEVLNYCDFAITDTVPFRNITTAQVHNGNYIRIKGGALSKTNQLLYLLKRGSIFYADDLEKIKQAFTDPAFQTIGYNHFIELK